MDEYPHGAAALQDIIDAAVTNANQHGEAAHVSINITCERYVDGTAFTVTVDDDGIGPPYAVTPGMGLSGIDAWGGTWALA